MGSSAISLFAGAGGMDIGAHAAGFNTVCAIESDPHCAATLRRNGARKVVWQADVRVVDPQRLLDALGIKAGEVGLLHGGPPCQPFSQIGKLEGLDDPRGALIFEVLRFASAIRPAAVLIEQVPNFLRTQTPQGRRLAEALREEFHALGYDMHLDLLDAQEHGVPQRRRRALFVCLPIGTSFAFPPASAKAVTVGTALRGLPTPSVADEPAAVANHVDVTPRRDQERIAYVPEGFLVGQDTERAAGHPAQSNAQGHHQVPTPAPRGGRPNAALRRGALPSAGRPLHHAPRSSALAGIPRPARV